MTTLRPGIKPGKATLELMTMKMNLLVMGGLIAASVASVSPTARAAVLPGLGEVAGTVSGPKDTVFPVYLYNKEKHVGYSVFVVDGAYRATNMFPGRYEITVQNGYVPSPIGLEMQPVQVEVTAGERSVANLAPRRVAPTLNYTGRETYPDGVKVQTYEEIYPKGPGRKILEHSCVVCHGVNFIPSKSLSRPAWQAMIDLMIKPQGDGGVFSSQLSGGSPVVTHDRLSPKDLPLLLDYLEENFGPESEQRAVLQENWPTVDREALAKAQFIEYRFRNTPSERRGSHSLNFDRDGIVYVSDPTERAVWRVDPATGETRQYPIPDGESTHGITVDGDGTVWIAGRGHYLAHLDPKTGLWDRYNTKVTGLHANTPVLTTEGNIWFTQLIGNGIGYWDRATDKVSYYSSPVPNADPYGMEIDHAGKVWYSEYFAGAITRFDPETETFKRFKVQTWPNSLRRLGADSKDNIWFGVYGYMGKYGKLGRIDAKTGQMTEIAIPIEYGQPYDTRPDTEDNIWIASMNYLSKFDPEKLTFTIYPMPERTDAPKPEVTRDGSVWYAPRYAASAGYGGAAVVLHPDKDAIKTLRAIPSTELSNFYVGKYKGPFTEVKGVIKWQSAEPRNKVDYEHKTVGRPVSEAKGGPDIEG